VWPFYAMDTCFYTSQGSYGLEARCAMSRELGYDAAYLTLANDASWQDLERLGETARANDLDVAAVWGCLEVAAGPDAGINQLLFDSLPLLRGMPRLELALRDTRAPDRRYDADDDDAARALVAQLAERLPDGVQVCLYPHINWWLERFDDAIELCRRIDDDRVGLCFASYHWFATQGDSLDELLAQAGEKLYAVNICGSRRSPVGPPTIEPLDDGELDNFALLGALERVGYRGPVGLQGYSVGGDCYGKLQRSLAAYRDMTRRLETHPEWAVLRP